MEITSKYPLSQSIHGEHHPFQILPVSPIGAESNIRDNQQKQRDGHRTSEVQTPPHPTPLAYQEKGRFSFEELSAAQQQIRRNLARIAYSYDPRTDTTTSGQAVAELEAENNILATKDTSPHEVSKIMRQKGLSL